MKAAGPMQKAHFRRYISLECHILHTAKRWAMFPCRLQNVNATSSSLTRNSIEGQFFLEMGLRRTIRWHCKKIGLWILRECLIGWMAMVSVWLAGMVVEY